MNNIFRKSVEKIPVSLKSDKNTGTLNEDRHVCVFNNIPLDSYQNVKCFGQKLQGKSKHIFYSQLFYENLAVYEMWEKNTVEWERPQVTIQHDACAFHAV